MRIPLFKRLKKRSHAETAMLQDELVDIVYSVFPKAVLHGGTAIWRCYSGNRFSEDLDFYVSGEEKFSQEFAKKVKSSGLMLLKYKRTKNAVFSKVSNGTVEVRFEAALRKVKDFEAKPYERTDCTFSSVFTLSAHDLIIEKMEAYSNRRLIRDLYDVYSLSPFLSQNEKVEKKAKEFLEKIAKPVDEKTLQTIVFSGAVPSFEQMLFSLKRRFGA